MLVGYQASGSPPDSTSSGASVKTSLAAPSPAWTYSHKANSASSSCGSTSGKSELNSGLGRMPIDLEMPGQAARLQRLSSSLNYIDLPPTPTSTPVSSMGDTTCRTWFAPATPSASKTPVRIEESLEGQGTASCHLSVDTAQGGLEPADCESTIAAADTGSTVAPGHCAKAELSSALLPLPDLPGMPNQDHDAKSSSNSTRYVHIGCALACLCVFALWAKEASAVSFSTRIFPT